MPSQEKASGLRYVIGGSMVMVRGALLRVPELFVTSVITRTTCPTVKGPTTFPSAASGALWMKSASTPTSIQRIRLEVVCAPPPGSYSTCHRQ